MNSVRPPSFAGLATAALTLASPGLHAEPGSGCPGILQYDPMEDITLGGELTGSIFLGACPPGFTSKQSTTALPSAAVALGTCGGFANAPFSLSIADDSDNGSWFVHASVDAGGDAIGFGTSYAVGASMTLLSRQEAEAVDYGCRSENGHPYAGAAIGGTEAVSVPFEVTAQGEYYLSVVLTSAGCSASDASGSWSVASSSGQIVVSGSIGSGSFADQGPIGPGQYTLEATVAVNASADACAPFCGSDVGDCTHQLGFSVNVAVSNEIGDLDGDGLVGTSDMLILLAAWGPCPSPPDGCPADFDGDGMVGTSDLLILFANWS